MPPRPYISVVIPIHNEFGNISSLDNELKASLSKICENFEVIYINDGSTDGSLTELHSLSGVTIIDLNRNYGQTTAFDAGFRHATGELVISMDGDGQNDPSDIPLLLKKLLDEELDVVAGWRKKRSDKNGIKVLTRIGRLFRKLLIKDTVHDTGCSFRIYRYEAVKSLDIGGEMHRYILALLRWKGFRIGEVVVNDRSRVYGVSKYNYTKAIRGLIDLLYVWFIHKYSQRPLHFFGYMSFVTFFVGLASTSFAIYSKIFEALPFNRNGWFFVGFFFLLAAIIFFSFGVVLDILIRISFATSSHEDRYYIRSVTKTL